MKQTRSAPEEGDRRIVLVYNQVPDLHKRSAICARALKDKGAPVFSRDGFIFCIDGGTGEKRIRAADVFHVSSMEKNPCPDMG